MKMNLLVVAKQKAREPESLTASWNFLPHNLIKREKQTG
jgi:hypothetical protein